MYAMVQPCLWPFVECSLLTQVLYAAYRLASLHVHRCMAAFVQAPAQRLMDHAHVPCQVYKPQRGRLQCQHQFQSQQRCERAGADHDGGLCDREPTAIFIYSTDNT